MPEPQKDENPLASMKFRLAALLQEGSGLSANTVEALQTPVEYFRTHREHIHYEAMAAQGCPNGSGAMESFCSQLQGRLKRCGQFWSPPGMAALLALEVARRNFDWDALWSQN